MKRIIIIAVLAYLVYYLYKQKNTGTSVTTKESDSDPNLFGGNLDSTYGPGNYQRIAKTKEEPLEHLENQIRLKKRLVLELPYHKDHNFKVDESVRLLNSKLYPGSYKIREASGSFNNGYLVNGPLITLNTPYIGDESGLIMVRQNTTSQAEPSLVDPVGTSNANIAALQGERWEDESVIRRASSEAIRIANEALIPHQPNLLDRLLERQASAIVEERTPALTGDTPYWMPNGQDMIYPRGLEFSIAAQYGNF
jgi:hypothetical protein